MKDDMTIHKGSCGKYAIVFIHGLGMDKRLWTKPEEARMLGGTFPIKFLLSKKPVAIDCGSGKTPPRIRYSNFSVGDAEKDLNTSFSDLRSLGYTVTAWSQKRPAGPIDIAVAELRDVIEIVKGYGNGGVILIGHSRGGLIARKYLESGDRAVKGLITLASPHRGSAIAKWADYISPLVSFISPLVREGNRKKFSYVINRVLDFVGSKAVKELLPDSEFFKSLKDNSRDMVYCVSFGGTSPSLFSLYKWSLNVNVKRGIFKWLLEPQELFSVPDALEKIIPRKIYPEELKKGYGDGLVSAKSSVLPGCVEHYNFNLNHAAILFDKDVRKKIVYAVEAINSE